LNGFILDIAQGPLRDAAAAQACQPLTLPATEKKIIEDKKDSAEILMGTETILLVDDEKMTREVTGELLASMGYMVYEAGSGQEAVAVFMEKRN